jgi:hypothetical protein
MQPELRKVTWVTSDPKSDFFRKLAEAVTTLEITPPVVYSPFAGLTTALEFPAREAAWNKFLLEAYEKQRKTKLLDYEYVPLAEPFDGLDFYGLLFEKPSPVGVATVVGGTFPSGVGIALPAEALPAAITFYQPPAYHERVARMAAALNEQITRRWPVGVNIMLAGSGPVPITPLAFYHASYLKVVPGQEKGKDDLVEDQQFLPFEIVRPEFRSQVEHRLAVAWAQDVMKAVRDELEKDRGNKQGMQLRLSELKDRYGDALEIRGTSRFRDRFDIAEDPSLEGFLKAFERERIGINQVRGAGGTEKELKEDDFYRLFFGGEPFSVGNLLAYELKPWPPVVEIDPKGLRLRKDVETPAADEAIAKTIDKWEKAENRILFWKTDSRQERPTEDLKAIHSEVEQAWKTAEARRDLALPRAQEIAKSLKGAQKLEGALLPLMDHEARKLGTRLIILDDVTPLIPAVREKQKLPLVSKEWVQYLLPRGKILHPTADMTSQLLALRDLKEPIKISLEKDGTKLRDVEDVVKRLNEINESLFDKDLNQAGPKIFPRGRAFQVQILTNRPRTVFYVAAVVREGAATRADFLASFLEAWGGAASSQLPRIDATGQPHFGDTFIDMVQADAGREFQAQFMQQLRSQWKLEVTNPGNFEKGGASP